MLLWLWNVVKVTQSESGTTGQAYCITSTIKQSLTFGTFIIYSSDDFDTK